MECLFSETQECTNTYMGLDYVGRASSTENDKQCINWSSLSEDYFSYWFFTDGNITHAENHCRNPDKDFRGLWCFTDLNQLSWGYCSIPMCGRLRSNFQYIQY